MKRVSVLLMLILTSLCVSFQGNSQQTSLGEIAQLQPLSLSEKEFITDQLAVLKNLRESIDHDRALAAREEIEPPVPLTLSEKQVIYGQLVELRIVRVQLDQAKTREADYRAQYEKEKAHWLAQVEEERLRTAAAVAEREARAKERDLALDQVQFYQSSLNACKQMKKPGFWCKLWRKMTLGIHKCI